MSDKVRVDKWLWAIRIFKSRTISTDTCKSGKVKCKDEVLKPSSLVSIGNIVEVRKNGFQFLFKVLNPITKRVSASEAVLCYANLTSEEELNKINDWFIGKSGSEWRERGEGRPTKKERREIDEFKEDQIDWDED